MRRSTTLTPLVTPVGTYCEVSSVPAGQDGGGLRSPRGAAARDAVRLGRRGARGLPALRLGRRGPARRPRVALAPRGPLGAAGAGAVPAPSRALRARAL